MSEACARWIALSDREALGATLSAAEGSFIAVHAANCAACGAEAATWNALASFVDADERHDPRVSDADERVAHTRRRVGWGAALACAAAIIFGLAVHGPRERTPPVATTVAPSPSPLPSRAAARAFSTHGGFDVDGRPARVEQTLEVGALVRARTGITCLGFEHGVRACLAQGSSLRVVEAGSARKLELLQGKIAVELDPQPPGSSFAILTREGSALAVGTAFSVEVPVDNGPVVTRVLHGIVLVRGTGNVELRVTAHQQASMRGELRELALADETRELSLLHGEEQVIAPPASAPQVAPLAPHVQDMRGAAHPRPRLQADGLLLRARERAAAGDVDGALAAYRELFERHAASPEAQSARVAYGEMLLGLHDAHGALAAFERYLAAGGALHQEASFGRIRALRALSRTAEERAAIADFLRSASKGPLADALRVRARELGDR